MAVIRIFQHSLRSSVWKWIVVIAALLPAFVGRSASAQECCPQGSPRILVLRGVFEIFSLGMNDLAEKLRCRGYDATCTSWSLALFTADCSGDRPLIVIGHSLGGRMCAWTSRLMNSCGHRVPLLIVVDANLLTPIPANVDECINLYVTNNFGIFHGSPVYAESPHTEIINWDISRGQPSMFLGGVNHFDIDATDWVHQIIIRQIECRFPLCPAMEDEMCEPWAMQNGTGPSGSPHQMVEIKSASDVSTTDEFENSPARNSRRAIELTRPSDATIVHVLKHANDDPFEKETPWNSRFQEEAQLATPMETASETKTAGRVERMTWKPTRPDVPPIQSTP